MDTNLRNALDEIPINELLEAKEKTGDCYHFMRNVSIAVLDRSSKVACLLICCFFGVDIDDEFDFIEFEHLPESERIQAVYDEMARTFLNLPDNHPVVINLRSQKISMREALPNEVIQTLDAIPNFSGMQKMLSDDAINKALLQNLPPATRERAEDIKKLVYQGKTNSQIGENIGLSEKQIKRDRKLLGLRRIDLQK